MTQGNRINHKKKWALDSDLKELKEKVYHFIHNDFSCMSKKVNDMDNKVKFLKIEVTFMLIFTGLILALLAILVVKII